MRDNDGILLAAVLALAGTAWYVGWQDGRAAAPEAVPAATPEAVPMRAPAAAPPATLREGISRAETKALFRAAGYETLFPVRIRDGRPEWLNVEAALIATMFLPVLGAIPVLFMPALLGAEPLVSPLAWLGGSWLASAAAVWLLAACGAWWKPADLSR